MSREDKNWFTVGTCIVLWALIIIAIAFSKKSLGADEPPVYVGLVEFTSTGCKPCKQMEPIIRELQADPNSGYRLIREFNIDDDEDLTRWANVQDTPTFIVYVNKVEFMRHIGKVKKKELIKWARAAALAANRQPKATSTVEVAKADAAAPRNWSWMEDSYGQGHFVLKK